MTHESLGMTQEKFHAYMAGGKSFNSVWESALTSCETLRVISANMKTIENLKAKNSDTMADASLMESELTVFLVSYVKVVVRLYRKQIKFKLYFL